MKKLRQIHLYLGCIFAPLIIYFSISGMWQVYRFNDLPKDEPTSTIRALMHELSKPHTHSTAPGNSPKTGESVYFNCAAALMGMGMAITSILGIVMAVKFTKNSNWVLVSLAMGLIVPIIFLFLVNAQNK